MLVRDILSYSHKFSSLLRKISSFGLSFISSLQMFRFMTVWNDRIEDESKLKAICCRRQNNWDSKIEIWFGIDKQHCWKRRKCWLPAFCFKKTLFLATFNLLSANAFNLVTSKILSFGRVNSLLCNPDYKDQRMEAFINILRKGENAGNQSLLLFPKCFLPFPQ